MSVRMNEERLNGDVDWDLFDLDDYHTQYNNEVIWDDRGLGMFAVSGLRILVPPQRQYRVALDICNGGVARGPMYLSPYVADEGSIQWADIGKPQLGAARQVIAEGNQGNLGPWQQHEDDLARARPEWKGSASRACLLGTAVTKNVFELEESSAEITTCLFGPESATTNPDEWEMGTRSVFRSVIPGNPVLMMYSQDSKGYRAGRDFPSTPVSHGMMLEVAKDELTHIQMYSVQPSPEARADGDKHEFECFAAILGLRKQPNTVSIV